MDKPKIRDMRPAIEAALKSVEDKFGVKAHVGSASYTPNNVVFKLEFAELVNGQAVTKDVEDFKQMAMLYGLKPEDLGKPFMFRNEGYTVSGLAPKRQGDAVWAARTAGLDAGAQSSDAGAWPTAYGCGACARA